MREPVTFSDFIGQKRIKTELKALLASNSNASILLRGNYGSGKTTLAKIYASYRGNYTYQQIPIILELPENVPTHIIDEIHLCRKLEKLYDKIGQQTFIFCTTEAQKLSLPFVSRCIELVLDEYSLNEIVLILRNRLYDYPQFIIPNTSLKIIASKARSIPRTAIQLLFRIFSLAKLENRTNLSEDYVQEKLRFLKIYKGGLTVDDVKYLSFLAELYPSSASINTISSAIMRNPDGVKELIEPFLLSSGLITISSRGRSLTEKGLDVILNIIGRNNYGES